MDDKIKITDIYDKNINFLIGAGASHGLLPTLALKIKDKKDGQEQTIETLAEYFDEENKQDLKTLLFMHYYKECIEPAMLFDSNDGNTNAKQLKVIGNYKLFLETLLSILQRRNNIKKNCNIFTTNYDGCFAQAADELQEHGNIDFIINDGASGFGTRYLQARHFNRITSQTGVFERHSEEIPQINLIHLHGSVYWYKDGENIKVDYSGDNEDRIIADLSDKVADFSSILQNEKKCRNGKAINETVSTALDQKISDSFWEKYNELPIVNPTKWKFHETVFEEHYYQMLRLLSYELEKPNSIFITFGFSFADEHILNLVKRSLSNPKLQLFICCFNEAEQKKMDSYFKQYRNVEYITLDKDLDFTAFNEEIFTTAPQADAPTLQKAEESA